MLPNIVDVAIRYGFKPSEPLNDGQVCISCPSKKTTNLVCFLNIKKNVYYCKCCKSGGGIKKFESLFNSEITIVEKYGAASLNIDQLRKIGWEHLKGSSAKFYRENHKKIWEEWLEYRNERLEKMYALFIVLISMENKNIGGKLYQFLNDLIEDSAIPEVQHISFFMDAYVDPNKENKWERNGKKIAKQIIKICRKKGDVYFNTAGMLIIFDAYKNPHLENVYFAEYIKFYSNKKFEFNYLQDFFNWEKYLYNSLVYSFAMFLLMQEETNEKIQVEIYMKISTFLKSSLLNYEILDLVEQYVLEDYLRVEWAKEGARLARLAWLHAKKEAKSDYLHALFLTVKYIEPTIQTTKGEEVK